MPSYRGAGPGTLSEGRRNLQRASARLRPWSQGRGHRPPRTPRLLGWPETLHHASEVLGTEPRARRRRRGRVKTRIRAPGVDVSMPVGLVCSFLAYILKTAAQAGAAWAPGVRIAPGGSNFGRCACLGRPLRAGEGRGATCPSLPGPPDWPSPGAQGSPRPGNGGCPHPRGPAEGAGNAVEQAV